MKMIKAPHVIMVFGLPGSGKSFMASRLASCLDAEYISSDVIRREIIHHRTYTPAEKERVYEAMLTQMEQAIGQNRSVVLDATFYRKDIRDKFEGKARELNLQIIFIEIRAEEKITEKRLKKRREYSEADLRVYLEIKRIFEHPEQKHLILESREDNIDHMLDLALQYIHKPHEQR